MLKRPLLLQNMAAHAALLADIEGECPHCGGHFVVSPGEVGCGVFRHAVLKATGAPVPPHAGREQCEQLVREDAVHGCAAPFRLEGEHFVAANWES